MFQHYRQKFASLSTSLIVGLFTVSLPNLSQAATFELTVDGLEGSGIITLDDETLTGEGIEEVSLDELLNGSFDWSFVIGEGVYRTIVDNVITGERTETNETFPVTLQSRWGSAIGGTFIFQDGELVDIDDYEWFYEFSTGYGYDVSELFIDNGVVSVESESYLLLIYYDAPLYVDEIYEWDIVRNNLPYQIATIDPWQDPNQSIPEPGLTAGLIVMGLGLLYQKAKA